MKKLPALNVICKELWIPLFIKFIFNVRNIRMFEFKYKVLTKIYQSQTTDYVYKGGEL